MASRSSRLNSSLTAARGSWACALKTTKRPQSSAAQLVSVSFICPPLLLAHRMLLRSSTQRSYCFILGAQARRSSELDEESRAGVPWRDIFTCDYLRARFL